MTEIVASASCLSHLANPNTPMSSKTLNIIGYSGQPQVQNYTKPLVTTFRSQQIRNKIQYAPQCTVNLMGRDLVTRLNITIFCTEAGLQLCAPSGPKPQGQIMFMFPTRDAVESKTKVFWSQLLTEQDTTAVQRAYMEWRPGQ